MRVLVAGATGVIGRQLVPLLKSVGQDVIALALADPNGVLEGSGAEVVMADALDRAALERAVVEAAPDAVVNMLTAIPAAIDTKNLDKEFETTNRLRTEGARNLLDAAKKAGVRRIIAQGLAYAYNPDSKDLANEDTPFWLEPPAQFVPVLAALKELERLTQEAGGLVLRFGHLYGPGSAYAADGSFTQGIKAGYVPLVDGGHSTFSFTHAHDAATAVVAALDKTVTEPLNVVDDDPAPMSEWLPVVAELLGAEKPQSVSSAMAAEAVGEWGVAYMTQLRGADNSRAKLHLDWRPQYASWRIGFADELMGKGIIA
ncbi:NAD-dependent epimerase/dehydratase family protein [Streptomyces tailanensis]|uniref:NAD-dependent epimerase/dehydratase family protein n=1 Tax=Streptomyces tailanensis TaxID=2569858 RepID=UPI00122DF26D|nr:NAD(P)-dependent oxidoreductase [Streptomyces tailanensis]